MADKKLFGSWIRMGNLSEDRLVASIAETTKRLLEQMHKSVEHEDDISLIFKLNPIEDDIYYVTGAWKCYGIPKGPVKRMPDREKYIEVLSKAAKTVKEFNEDAPIKMSLECVESILELLKEQETEWEHLWDEPNGTFMGRCKKCGFVHLFIEGHDTQYKFCPECGKVVK